MAPLRLISFHLLLGWIALVVNADFYDGSFFFFLPVAFLSSSFLNGISFRPPSTSSRMATTKTSIFFPNDDDDDDGWGVGRSEGGTFLAWDGRSLLLGSLFHHPATAAAACFASLEMCVFIFLVKKLNVFRL